MNNSIKISYPIFLFLLIFFNSISFSQTTLLADFGASEAENVYGLSGWNILIKSPNVSYSSEGPDGLLPNPGVEEFDDYQGVQGTSRNFVLGERIVVTWYNTSASETYVIAARVSFEDSDMPDAEGTDGMWYTMRSFADYRNAYQEIPPGETIKTVFNITDSGVHATTGNHSVVNVNLHCEWFETDPKQYILCDKIELYDDADITPPGQVQNLTVGTITDSKVSLSWDEPSDDVGVVEYLVYLNGIVEGYTRTNSYTAVFLGAATQYNFTVSALDFCGNESAQSNSVSATTLAFQGKSNALDPAGFVYQGAIALPETFSYGGEAITYNPNGDGGQSGSGSGDGFAGSLFISNLNNDANGLVGEVSIPAPVISAGHNQSDLTEAAIIQTPVNIRPTNINNWDYVDIWRNGLEYVESENRLYNSWTIHYTVNEEKRATISRCDPNDLLGSTKYGAWYVGNIGQPPLESATSDYIFETPQDWADVNVSGRSMITGRFRDGGLSGLGPTFYAFDKVGTSPPAADAELPITTLLEYGSVQGTDNYNYPNSIDDYNHADAWRTGEWIQWETKSAAMIIGNKAHGDNWYGYQGENMRLDWIIADCPQPEFESTDPDGKGWRAQSYMPMAIFYNPSDLAQVAAGTMETYEPQPYAAIRFDENLFWGPKSEISSTCFDAENERLFVTEYNAPNDGWIIVHVFEYDGSLVPVEMNLFTATVKGNSAHLAWETASETNNARFEIERTSNGRTIRPDIWNRIGTIDGSGTSSSRHFYSFEDKNLKDGEYQYRLKQFDYDGSFEYSSIVNVTVGQPVKFKLFQNYPNPANPATIIEYSIPKNGLVTLTVYDALGKKVQTLINEFQTKGNYKIDFNASELPSGIYFYTLTINQSNKSKKMMILK
ncbi:MAG: T9SS type A sorting domain-containing protein [Chlorobi bacterium]|nr:T9SS type A sorting domain-containing protein [Chlorobiota bacterium]